MKTALSATLAAALLVVSLPTAAAEKSTHCPNFDPLRLPFFGTTHLHTGLSFDASIRFVDYRLPESISSDGVLQVAPTPRNAYRFAKGKVRILLPNALGQEGVVVGHPDDTLRRPMLERATDWGTVTDHSEHFGEMGICKDFLNKGNPGDVPGRLSLDCRLINGFYWGPQRNPLPIPMALPMARLLSSDAFTQLGMMGLAPVSKMTHMPVCLNNPDTCKEAETKVWEEMQNAAREENEPCSFTTFIGYENTSTPAGTNWHRNVIFRNDRVVRRPITAIDMAVVPNKRPLSGGDNKVGVPPNVIGGIVRNVPPIPDLTVVAHPLPERLWNALESDCLKGENITPGEAEKCDVIVIPHNTNLGGGAGLVPPLFFDPFNAVDAARRQRFEPLVEIYQNKGSSECRYDPRFADNKRNNPAAGVDTIDEFCNFELLDTQTLLSASGLGGSPELLPPSAFNDRAYVRNIWKDGLTLAKTKFKGINPFKMGVVASSDSHNGVMGFHPEDASFPGHLGIDDLFPVSESGSIQNSSGGHSVVWAEENTRDAIFDALQRKETYGTSGTRIVARFFGGWDVDFDDDLCRGNFVETGYDKGVPMGGDLPKMSQGATKPRFIAAAWKDDSSDGRNLQQIQIIKGWVDESGDAYEKVLTVAGRPSNANNPQFDVGITDCQPKPGGSAMLCRVWEDRDFDPDQAAFYYSRVLEEPVCRYSTKWCQVRIGVNPLSPTQCQTDLAALANSKHEGDKLKAQMGALCCSNQTTFPIVQTAIQERAWTSPIWYTPAK